MLPTENKILCNSPITGADTFVKLSRIFSMKLNTCLLPACQRGMDRQVYVVEMYISKAKMYISTVLMNISRTKMYISTVIMNISSVKMYISTMIMNISRMKMYISTVKMCISRAKMYISTVIIYHPVTINSLIIN